MSGDTTRATRDTVLGDTVGRVRVLERVRHGNRTPWILLQNGIQNGDTITADTDYYFELGGLLVSPLNGGGTIDSNVFGGIDLADAEVEIMTGGSSNEPFKAVHLRQPGLYYCQADLGWFTDWGPARVNLVQTHSDGETSVLSWRNFLNSSENSYGANIGSTKLAGTPASAAVQFNISYRQIFSVDERAEDVHVRVFAVNADAGSHTWNDTDRVGGMGLFIVRLSESGDSNPLLLT